MKKTYLTFLAALIALIPVSQATTVIAPSFDELVDQAEVIFQGEVTAVKSQWAGEGAQRHIISYVSFQIEDSLKGNPGQSYTIRMLGGTVGDESMGVTDAPKFAVGDRDILFVEHNGTQFIPLVGIMFGRFHVQRDQAGRESVMTNEGDTVNDLAQFKAAVRTKMSRGGAVQ
ncbi:MAG: hypothetical protein ABI925_10285 [Verrucomicrobiota bacterium]